MPESDLSQPPPSIPEPALGVRRRLRCSDKPLRILRAPQCDQRRIDFSDPSETVKLAKFQHGEKMALVFDPNIVTRVGLRHVTSGRHGRFRDNPPRRGYFVITFNTKEMADALIPPDGDGYEPEVEMDPGTGTLWFGMPFGRSVLALSPYFGHAWPNLLDCISEWFNERLHGERVVPGYWGLRHVSNSYTLRLYDTEGTHKLLGDVILDIPEGELLQDPIRNGSAFKEHGFNPWNEDQKMQIRAHLESLGHDLYCRVTTTSTVVPPSI